MKEAGFRVRCEKELHEEFMATCRLQGKYAADVVRNFMRAYVAREHGGLQGSLFDQREPNAANAATEGGANSWQKRA